MMGNILDPVLGSKLRAILVIVAGIVTMLGQVIDELERAGWAMSLPVLLAILSHWTPVGNQVNDA
jgi:hypothetical protein